MRPEKKSYVEGLRADLDASEYLILTDFMGMTVTQTEELRKKLAVASAKYRVVKNSLLRKVIEDSTLSELNAHLTGSSAVVFGGEDVVEIAKIVKDFVKANKLPTVKAGAMEGDVLSSDEVSQLADMPPKLVMQGILVGTIAAPMSGLVGVFDQKLASLVYVLKAAQEKLEAN